MTQGLKVGDLYAVLGLDKKAYDRDLAVARADAKGKPIRLPVGIDMPTLESIQKKLFTMAAVATAGIGAAIALSVKGYAEFAIQVAKLNAQTDMGAEATSRFVGELQMLHVNTSSAGMAIKTMEKAIYGLQTGAGTAVAAFQILGLTWADLAGLKPEDQIALIRDRLSEVADPGARAAAATVLLGRGAKDMTLWYTASAKQMDAVNASLQRNHQILSESQLKDAEKAALAWQNFLGALKGVEYTIAQDALPELTNLANALAVVLNAVRPFTKEIGLAVAALLALGAFVKVTRMVQEFNAALSVVKATGFITALKEIIGLSTSARGGRTLTALLPDAVNMNAAQFGRAKVAADAELASLGGLQSGLARAGMGFKSLALSVGPWLVVAAAATAAIIGIEWAYGEWQKAEQQLSDASKGFADNVTAQFDRIAKKYGETSSQMRDFSKMVQADIDKMLSDTRQLDWGKTISNFLLGGGFKSPVGGSEMSAQAKQAKDLYDQIEKILNTGPVAVGSPTEKKLVGLLDQMKAIPHPTQAVKDAIAAVAAQLQAIDPHVFDTVAEAAAGAAQQVDLLKMVTLQLPGMSGPATMSQGQAIAGGWMDAATGAVKNGAVIVEAVQQTAAQTAAAGADLAMKLKDIPKNIVKILDRDWVGIGAAFNKAMLDLNAGFGAGMSDALVAAYAARTQSLASIASGLETILKAFSDAPKKAVSPTRQNWTMLAQVLLSAMNEILAVFASVSDKLLGSEDARMANVASAAGSLGSFIGALFGMPKKVAAPARQAWTSLATMLKGAMAQILAVFADTKGLGKEAERAGNVGSIAGSLSSFITALSEMPTKGVKVIPQAWTKLAATLKAAMAKVLAVFADVKGLAGSATRMGSIGSLAGGLGSLISALFDLPDKAVSVVPQKWKALARVVKTAAEDVLSAFKEATTKELGAEATRTGSIADMAGGLGSILDLFVNGPDAAVAIVPQKWHMLAEVIRRAVEEVLTVYKDMSDKLLSQQGDRMGLIGNLIGPLGDVLAFFANAPKTTITTMRQNWAAFGTALIEAVDGILQQFEIWDEKALKQKSTKMGFIGTMTGVIRDVADLAASLPDMQANLQAFSTMSFGNLWQGIGSALSRMMNEITGALQFIPDEGKLATAQAAMASLRDIFASMVDISNSMNNRLSAGVAGGAAVAATSGAAAGAGNVYITIPWQTYTGSPSRSEVARLVSIIEPELNTRKGDKKRGGFG